MMSIPSSGALVLPSRLGSSTGALNVSLEDQVSDMKRRVTALEHDVAGLRHSSESLQADLTQARKRRNEEIARANAADARRAVAEEKVDAAVTESVAATVKVGKMQAEVDEMKRRNKKLERENDDLKEKLERLGRADEERADSSYPRQREALFPLSAKKTDSPKEINQPVASSSTAVPNISVQSRTRSTASAKPPPKPDSKPAAPAPHEVIEILSDSEVEAERNTQADEESIPSRDRKFNVDDEYKFDIDQDSKFEDFAGDSDVKYKIEDSKPDIESLDATPLSDLSDLSPDESEDEAETPEPGPSSEQRRQGGRQRKPSRKTAAYDDEDFAGSESDGSEIHKPPAKRRRTTMTVSIPSRHNSLHTGVPPITPTSKASSAFLSTPSSTSLTSRISSLSTYPLRLPAGLPHALPRNTITGHFHMQGMTLVSTIKPQYNIPPGRARQTIWPDPDQNPALPARPGLPGSLLCDRTDFSLRDVYSLWIKKPGQGPALWMYFGDYRLTRGTPLNGEEFEKLSKATRRKWVRSLLKAKKACYVRHLAYIYLHKFGLPAKPEDVEIQTAELLANKDRKGLTEEDVMDGLCSGVANIGVMMLECVDYSHDFKEDIDKLSPR